MIRATAVPRSVRVGAAMTGIAGMMVLGGCAAQQSSAEEEPAQASSAPSASAAAPSAARTGSTYADGTYTAEGSYQTPESVESVRVTVTLQDDEITAVEVTGQPKARESQQYQSQFIGGISDVVVGKNIDEISVSRVAGSSLTSGGFNKAIDEIKAEATA